MPKNTPADFLDRNRYPFWALALAMGAVLFLLYSVSLGHNFLFDEENIILNNPTIRSLRLIPEIFKHGYFYFHGRPTVHWDEYYRPLTSITFSIDYFFWGVDPFGYNLTNLLLHITLCVLYFALLSKLLGHRTAAFLAALLYAVHTIHTEAVTYTASRGDILGMVLMLAALLAYADRRRFLPLIFYFLALFSKETTILLPFYILALDIAFRMSRPRELVKNAGPFFLLMICFWLFRKFLCPVPFTPFDPDIHAILLRVLGMGDGILRYVRALLAPEYFRAFADVPVLYGFNDPLLWTSVTVGALLLAAWLLSLRHKGAAFFGMSVVLVGLVPHMQLVNVYPKWAEHYICISSLGLFLLLGILIRNLLEKRDKKLIAVFFAVYLPFIAFISFRTWQRNETYNDPQRYYTLLSQNDTPYRFYGYQQLARLALEHGEPDKAYVYLNVARQQEFRSEFTHELLGHYYSRKERPEQALREFKLAYYYSSASARELPFIGTTLIELGRYREAADIFLLMRRIDPDSMICFIQLMNVYEIMHDTEKVRAWAEVGLKTFHSAPAAGVPIRMLLARFDYMRGLHRKALAEMGEIVCEAPDAPGNADLARLCLGQMAPRKFLGLVAEKYPYFKNSAPSFVLMAEVLQGNKKGALQELRKNRKKFWKLSRKNPLTRRELAQAEKFVLGRQGSFDRV